MRLNRLAISSIGVFLSRGAAAFTCTPSAVRIRCVCAGSITSPSFVVSAPAASPHPHSRCSSSRAMSAADSGEATLPTIEQAAKDPFMSQLSHAGEICALLEKEGNAEASTLASDLLGAQLSHSDGIRGFFATYLTSEGAADKEEIPEPLMGAMDKADMEVLVPLACMNVVMPTAMTSMHTDPEMSNNAAKTAKRGTRVLKHLQDKDDSVKTNCDAIRAVATGGGADSCVEERFEYWTKFFENYGYGDKEKEGIAEAMQEFF